MKDGKAEFQYVLDNIDFLKMKRMARGKCLCDVERTKEIDQRDAENALMTVCLIRSLVERFERQKQEKKQYARQKKVGLV